MRECSTTLSLSNMPKYIQTFSIVLVRVPVLLKTRGNWHYCPKTAIVCLHRSHLSRGNDPITVTAGQVYYKLQLSCSILRPEPADWSFYWRSFTRTAPRGVFGPLLYRVSPPLETNLNHSTTWTIFAEAQVCECAALLCWMAVDYRRSRRACGCLSLMNVYLPSWCPVWANTFIFVLPKADPDGILSSNAPQAEETPVCFHRGDDAYLSRSWWW